MVAFKGIFGLQYTVKMTIRSPLRLYLFITGFIYCFACNAQPVTIPWGAGINMAFGKGASNPGPPLPPGRTEFIYSTDSCIISGQYSIVNKATCTVPNTLKEDAGHTFLDIVPMAGELGYMMVVNAAASPVPKILYVDTIRNVCTNKTFLFSMGIHNFGTSSCMYPNLTMSVETLSGQVLQSFQTGNAGGSPDNYAWYPGFWPFPPPAIVKFPKYYGFYLTLPPGQTTVVAKISVNPSGANSSCSALFAVDNIMFTTMGPKLSIALPNSVGGWLTGSCFQGNTPVKLDGSTGSQQFSFGAATFISPDFVNPAFQWQRSIDGGFNWQDVPGQTNTNLSYHFSISDTFFVRLRASEAAEINEIGCSVVSNVIKVQVDGLPTDFSFTSNSPVCEDGDLKFTLDGGASYVVRGPNNYFDNTPFPHVYNPALSNTGWYYADIKSYGGCSAKDSTYVQIVGPDIKVSPSQAICYGKPAQLSASGGVTYLWTPSTGLNDASIATPLANPVVTTKYKVKVTDNTGCGAFGTVTISLRDSLLKAIVNGPSFACPTDIVLLKDSSAGVITSWYWDFDDGQIASIKDPSPRPFLTLNNILKDYRVKLIVTDTAGCIDTALKVVTAVPNCYIDVPNAFTPNNDGINDYLYPINAYKASSLRFRVFNRGGQLIFETRDRNFRWDGSFRGEPQSPGTYIWMLEYIDSINQKISLKGTAVLIR